MTDTEKWAIAAREALTDAICAHRRDNDGLDPNLLVEAHTLVDRWLEGF